MSFGDQSTQAPKPSNGKMFWTTAMDDCMLDVFLLHLAQGRRTPQGWKKSVTYHAVKEAFMADLKIDVTANHVENRVKVMRGHVMAYKSLNQGSCSGFGWSSETMRLTADELVWNEALKVNSNLKSYKKKILPRFMEWMEVLGDHTANGNLQKTSFTADLDADDDDSIEMQTQNANDPLLGNFKSFDVVDLEEDGLTQKDSIPATVTPNAKPKKIMQRKRKTMASGVKEEMGNMRGAIENFMQVMQNKNNQEDILWDQLSDAIFDIEDMDEDAKVEALDSFSGDHVENLKRCFLRIPANKRKDWIMKKLEDGKKY